MDLEVVADLGGTELHATAQTLPDDVLLDIFGFHRLASHGSSPWIWYGLSQVCRKWRFAVFAYPRFLKLRIVATYNKSIPDFWPTIPIIIWYPQSALHPFLSLKDEDDIREILKNPARICEMHINMTSQLVRNCASLLGSFPALEHLRLNSPNGIHASFFPKKFLDGSTPRLRAVHLDNIAFPMLYSSSKNVISLRLENIFLNERFFTPENLAIGLSAATRLESLKIDFHSRFSIPRQNDLSSLPTRFVLPALIEFHYAGQSKYLQDFASRIDAPIIEQIEVTCFCSVNSDIYELCDFFGLEEELRSSLGRTTHIRFFDESVVLTHHFSRFPSPPGEFRLQLPSRSTVDAQFPFMTRICLGFQSWGALRKVTLLEIEGFPDLSRGPMVMDLARWHSILRNLTGVKRLHVFGKLVPGMVSALAQVTMGALHEILPALRDLHLQCGPETFASTSATVKSFIKARKLHGVPLSVHYREQGIRLV